jgi:UDP-N-acetylglucosamine 2-epimerase (non-hydrolysing)
MKIAPLMEEYTRHPAVIKATLPHTGQHNDDAMSRIFFTDLDILEPDIDLGVGSGSHAAQPAGIMVGIEKAVLSLHPDLVGVVGDVNSTMACAIVVAK